MKHPITFADHLVSEWQSTRLALGSASSIGFVPTMGNLHQGHIALIKRSLSENDVTVASIFVNPTQFNDITDYEAYPNTQQQDLEYLAELNVDFCLMPTKEQLYPDGYQYQIQETHISKILEGQHRPGHFQGMLTVVMKLFHLVQPNRAYFGEKDFQQLTLIQHMVSAFLMPIEIVSCPTIRDSNGLALSSRNQRLSQQGYKKACLFAEVFHQAKSCQAAIQSLEKKDIAVEYIEEFEKRRYGAVRIENIRLIDNCSISC